MVLILEMKSAHLLQWRTKSVLPGFPEPVLVFGQLRVVQIHDDGLHHRHHRPRGDALDKEAAEGLPWTHQRAGTER